MTDFRILLDRIPRDGMGRTLTAPERQALAAAGHTVSRRARVISDSDTDWVGCVYEPAGDMLTRVGNWRVRTRD